MNTHTNANAKFAPVAPIHILEDMQRIDRKNLLGYYHLFLAHHTVEEASRFHNLVHRQMQDAYARTMQIIMDNSIVELGGAVDDQMIKQAVEAVRVTNTSLLEVIPCLPDVMGDGAATVEMSSDAYDRWMDMEMPGSGFMVVTQGKDWEEFTDVVNHFFLGDNRQRYRNIRWVGIPRKLGDTIGTRALAIQYIQMVAPHVRIHLLGFSRTIADDLFCARMPGVSGIDSAVPVRYSKVLTPMTSDEAIGPRGDWWEKGVFQTGNASNIDNVRKWLVR